MRTLFSRLAIIAICSLLTLPALVHAAALPGSLIKLSCAAHTEVNDPCKAVYYVGGDGKRHAFPNDKTYFTWFADFAAVKTVSSSALAAIPLGSNVSYRPGVKLVKFTTVDKVYAVSLGSELRWITTESAATDLYGADWNKKVDDISDAFFLDYRIGADIASATDYHKDSELMAAASLDANLPSTSKTIVVTTEHGTFTADVIMLQQKRFAMITDTADTTDCQNGCASKSLADFVTENQADVGMNGAYACPPDYAECANKTNSFLSPVYNSAAGTMINTSSLVVHEGPILATTKDGRSFFYHRTKEFGSSVAEFESKTNSQLAAAISNYPSLVENGQVIVESEARLAETKPTIKSLRGGIGVDEHFYYLVIVHSATVSDLAWVMKTLGATDALNLDGGGTAALRYNGAYVIGPGRTLSNAVLFKARTP